MLSLTSVCAQRADNYPPTRNASVKFTETNLPIVFINVDGKITYPEQGQFVVHLSKEDTSNKTGDYFLVISLVGDNMGNIISSNPCQTATFRICEQ